MKCLAVLLVLALQEPPTTLTLTAPKDSKPAEIEKAAKAMEKRCAEIGYKGVKFTVQGGEIVVSCDTGITDAMQKRINDFAVRPYAKLEFMLQYPASAIELEQYQEGKTSPKGTSWVKLPDGTSKLVIDGTRMNVSGKISWEKPTDQDIRKGDYWANQPGFQFPEDATKIMRNQVEAKKHAWIIFLIDGRQADSEGMIQWHEGSKKGSVIALWKCKEAENEFGGICLNNPLPFALTEKK